LDSEVRIVGIKGIPEVSAGAALADLILAAIQAQGEDLRDGDTLVVAQKVVSKAEGSLAELGTVQPSPFARRYGRESGKDPRYVEVILQESRRIVRMDRGHLIAETHHGFVCANAAVDMSNSGGRGVVALLPRDPDRRASELREAVRERLGVDVAVIISDTFGRPWRVGAVNVAVGVAGLEPLLDYVGQQDPCGYVLRSSAIAVADELASAAELVMGKLSRIPVAIIRGYPFQKAPGSARSLVRSPEDDLFR